MDKKNMFCDGCGQMTRKGKEEDRERYRKSPIWKTDFNKPLSELIEDVRKEIVQVRGMLTDLIHGYDCSDGYRTIQDVEGLMTCALISLHSVKQDRLKTEKFIDKRKEQG